MPALSKRTRRPMVAALAFLALPLAAPASAQSFDDAERAEIGEIIRDYLIANPDVMLEVQAALEAQQLAREEAQRQDIITAAGDDLFRHAGDPVLGNPAGDVTVVEFFDYNCGFCHRAMADMNALIESDPNVRFVLKEFPILGEDSQAAHRVALAFNRVMPQNYAEFHDRLMSTPGRVGESQAMEVALALGADERALRTAMAGPEVVGSLETTYLLAEALGIGGTPSYVIGNELVRGALGEDALRAAVEKTRQCAQTGC